MSVRAATEAFGSELRVHLIHYFAAHGPKRQVDAAQALGADRAVVSLNTRALLATGVLVEAGSKNSRSRTFAVDHERFRELLAALEEYGNPRSGGDPTEGPRVAQR